LLGEEVADGETVPMNDRSLSSLRRFFLFLPVIFSLAGCGEEEGTLGPGPAQTEFPPIVGTGGGTPTALRLNEQLLKILPREAGKNWVFDGYRDPSTKEVAWSRTWTSRIDFTGVAWDDTRTMTLITPRHVVMARHYKRGAGDIVRFHDRSGKEVQRVLVGWKNFPGTDDVTVGILNQAVPSGVRHYKLLEPAPDLPEKLLGTLALVTDSERKVHVHEANVQPQTVRFRFPRSLPKGFFEPLVKGDSGNPSFLFINGEPVLFETHMLGGAGTGPFYGSAEIQAGIRGAMERLAEEHGGAEYTFETVRP